MSFFSVVFADKKQPKQVRKMPEIRKIYLRSGDNIFLKSSSKIHKFWSFESRSWNFS